MSFDVVCQEGTCLTGTFQRERLAWRLSIRLVERECMLCRIEATVHFQFLLRHRHEARGRRYFSTHTRTWRPAGMKEQAILLIKSAASLFSTALSWSCSSLTTSFETGCSHGGRLFDVCRRWLLTLDLYLMRNELRTDADGNGGRTRQ